MGEKERERKRENDGICIIQNVNERRILLGLYTRRRKNKFLTFGQLIIKIPKKKREKQKSLNLFPVTANPNNSGVILSLLTVKTQEHYKPLFYSFD